jgi:hypothetical protein
LIHARELWLPVVQHQLTERGELHREGGAAYEAQAKAL